MNKKINSGLAVILPNKKINLFVIFVILLGVISGAIFLISLNKADSELVTEQITDFFNNINSNNINNFNAFKNAFIENGIFIFVMWIFGMSIVGIIFNVFAMYLKGFITGFTLSSLFYVYKVKGLLAGAIYLIPSGALYLFITLIIGAYSIVLTTNLWKIIFIKDRSNSISIFIKKYLIVFGISLILVIIAALCEGYLLPSLLKLIIKLFI